MTEASSRYGCFDWRAEAIVSSTSAFANAPIPGQKVHVVAQTALLPFCWFNAHTACSVRSAAAGSISKNHRANIKFLMGRRF